MNETEFCKMTINGEDLDDYLHRERIAIRVCTLCNPNYEKGLPYVYQYCEKHQAEDDIRQKALRALNDRKMANMMKPKKRARSDGKTEIRLKYERCMNRSERRQKKIDRRK